MFAALDTTTLTIFILCIICVCAFEFVNGFHDTANAVATVIYTNTLKPRIAVVWSGIWNFLGVYAGGIAVAMGIIKLLPLAGMAAVPLSENIALILAILISAIIWNVATWYIGIPCSSSHTLIGALLGAGMVFHFMYPGYEDVNWHKAQEIGISLLVSPLFGFTGAVALMFIFRFLLQTKKAIFKEPEPGQTPPLWIRAILVTTCTLVSFFHGSNDGQKGVGLLMIVLMTFLPLQFAMNGGQHFDSERVVLLAKQIKSKAAAVNNIGIMAEADDLIEKVQTWKADKSGKNIFAVRRDIQTFCKLVESHNGKVHSASRHQLKELKGFVEYAPWFAILMISLSLGIGTMIGWKRIVITIGEKIGKRHMTYAEGATAELMAAGTIGLSTGLGLPVSTTHVLSSGVAGSMTASKGINNLQAGTIKSIAIAWLLTLPVTIVLAGGLFWIFRLVV